MKDDELGREVQNAILEVALSMDEPELLDHFLRQALGDHPEAMEEMRGLVEASRRSMGFFLEAADQRRDLAAECCAEQEPFSTLSVTTDEQVGEVLGDYCLVARLGEGSGGVIYEAEQGQPIQRRVAVKILRAGMDTELMIARFESERQALALMDHPHISRVLDAGATPAGRPYFVMELVEGEKITLYCDRHQLGLVERLQLFVEVCRAIEHAHQKGIIHRDIKPSNILVATHEGRPVPKVIDFGIAKMVHPLGEGRKVITFHDELFGTPAYMSPEQIDLAGLDVDTRSDIYSLGILLHELLTGVTPLDEDEMANLGVSALRDRVLNAAMQLPSRRCAMMPPDRATEMARVRGCDVRAWIAAVAGDLDGIVMKATERSRHHRYQTVDALAVDIGRHLQDLPVSARAPSRAYLLGKFVRRNRAACAVAAGVAGLLITGLVTTTTLYKRERRALDEQSRLRMEAQAARKEEERLRWQADARSNLARVAFLLNQNRVEEADELRQRYPITAIEPSLEAAAVFRALGDWNASHDRWDQALECFRLLIQANRLEQSTRILEGSDLMACGIALLYRHQPDFPEFREEILDRYLPATTQVGAEHLLKVCCAAPAGPEMLARLETSVESLGDPADAVFPGWAALSLGLYHLRGDDLNAASRVAWEGLALKDAKSSCTAALHCVLAMTEARRERSKIARSHWEEARKLAQDCGKDDFIEGEPIEAVWFDWALVAYLLDEASHTLERVGASTK
ncbi:hypothetical protein HNR46_001899 [Haloferula luteola]|uniref:Protein kinase domain-containing protein n=1 Tax=Haloferula luteola TaxID=595692 RepID=A0A840VCM0_9BACT|nr:serine/threonine-protein kinase [Haloferula luteola]MBB5351660.1 hypothetical protein [Haloferula luteola]